MKKQLKTLFVGTLLTGSALVLSQCAHEPITQTNAASSSRRVIATESRAALRTLYAQNPQARKLANSASGILVFPSVLKGGLIVGAEGGNGALFDHGGVVAGYYQTAGASYGLQAGVQKFSYALFLMNPAAVQNLNKAGGWEVGSSPSVVVVDRGAATELSTTTVQKGTYAFFFDQKGLMAGLGLKGSKITKIHPAP